jgi:hypothetical protein
LFTATIYFLYQKGQDMLSDERSLEFVVIYLIIRYALYVNIRNRRPAYNTAYGHRSGLRTVSPIGRSRPQCRGNAQKVLRNKFSLERNGNTACKPIDGSVVSNRRSTCSGGFFVPLFLFIPCIGFG